MPNANNATLVTKRGDVRAFRVKDVESGQHNHFSMLNISHIHRIHARTRMLTH